MQRGKVRPIGQGERCEDAVMLFHIRGALLQKLVCYASGQRVGERSAKYGERDEVESRFMVRHGPNSHDLRYVDRIWVPTSLYAPRRWESKLTSDALFVSTFWAVFSCTKVK
jgi:hypothetical protein